ncbi:hemerythrin domain-containing protein [Kangiella aquimarina]|uniref:Hemerythrin domain-containing protein n=1 Tax=Kangiella aquimarina TaxID=261965 RepID=A0ABZ0X4M2_9GAMM|nr:hemerythrin domain-containing protein [Kangiella aquimarina]WQG85538.1 hemerythrin domain-containing protein [Kangiella aquimarina]
MFGFIKNFFRDRPENIDTREPNPIQEVDFTKKRNHYGISYDPHLIDNLKGDHNHLVALYGRIWTEGFEANNREKLADLVTQFKRDFQAHLLKENVKFYVYLEQKLSDDSSSMDLVKDFRSEMNDIAQAVIRFCKTYSKPIITAEQKESFKKDFETVGKVLTHRVSLEENELYTLYQPN